MEIEIEIKFKKYFLKKNQKLKNQKSNQNKKKKKQAHRGARIAPPAQAKSSSSLLAELLIKRTFVSATGSYTK